MFRLSFIYMDHRNEQTYPAVLGTWSTLKSWLSWKQNLTYTCAKLDYHSLPVEPGILWQWFLRSWFLGIPLLGAGVKWFSIRLSLTSSSNPPKRALSTLFCHLFANFTCLFAGFRIVGKMYNLNGLKFVFSRWSSQFTIIVHSPAKQLKITPFQSNHFLCFSLDLSETHCLFMVNTAGDFDRI